MVLPIKVLFILVLLFQSHLGFSFGKKKPPIETNPPPVTQPPPIVNPPPTPPPVEDVIPPPAPPPISQSCIVIDAGHGGHDPGAGNATYILNEKDVALKFVLGLRDLFQEYEINVRLTRDSDFFIPLSGRVDIANESKCEYFVSIHLNSFNTKAEGFETYYGRENSKSFAISFHNGWAPWMNSPNRGVKHANFAVIRSLKENRIMTAEEIEVVSYFNVLDNESSANLKSILVELYFIDNNREIERYLNEVRVLNGVFESLKNIILD